MQAASEMRAVLEDGGIDGPPGIFRRASFSLRDRQGMRAVEISAGSDRDVLHTRAVIRCEHGRYLE